MAQDVFISYANQDKAIADQVCAALEHQGIRCWIAPRDIQPAEIWAVSIMRGLKASRVLVLVLSAGANSSQHVVREVERAVHLKIPIVPFRVENVLAEGALELHLGVVHWLDAMTLPLEPHLQRLVNTLQAILKSERQQSRQHATFGHEVLGQNEAGKEPPVGPLIQPPVDPKEKAPTAPTSETQETAELPRVPQAPPAKRAESGPPPVIKKEPPSPGTVPAAPPSGLVNSPSPYLIIGGLIIFALIVFGGLGYWWTHRPDPLDPLRQVDWAKVQFNDPHFADCQNYDPCVKRKNQATRLTNTVWSNEPYNSDHFADCMGFVGCKNRKDQAEKIKQVSDWSKVTDRLLLSDCMGNQDCEKANLQHWTPPLPTARLVGKPVLKRESFGECSAENAAKHPCCEDHFHDPAELAACKACRDKQDVGDCVGAHQH
jgi:TIR domain